MKFPNGNFHQLLYHEEMVEKLLKKDEALYQLPTIPEFFANQEIFITGGTGFVGKVLIEKLLRSCPKIKTIYLLLRPKEKQSISERLKSLCDQVVFDALRVFNPRFMDKIIAVEGDVSELGLGLSESDKKLMKNVSIIYHSAASVRFDDPLKDAVFMNTRGTRELMEFAITLKNIKCVMHVSTTFNNLGVGSVKEEIYPPIADWKEAIKICEKMDSDILNHLTKSFINFMPNTYVFSKNLAEHVSVNYKDRIPIIIFRPSIIFSAWHEPFSGYVDNFNGPMGILLASHIGIVKTMRCDPKTVLDMCPVDACVKAMIISTWKRAHEKPSDLPVINAATSKNVTVTLNQFLDFGINGCCAEFPMGDLSILPPSGGVTLCPIMNYIRLFLYQLIPAMIIDTILKIKGQRQRLMKIQRKIFEANKALSYFTSRNFDFQNENFMKLSSYLRPEDLKAFENTSHFKGSLITYTRCVLYGFRRYLLNLKDSDIENDRRKAERIKLGCTIFKYFVYFLIFWLIMSKTDIVKNIINFF